MELKKGDLVKHTHHDKIGYGIILSNPHDYKGCRVCKIEWVLSNRRHIIDIFFLDKITSA